MNGFMISLAEKSDVDGSFNHISRNAGSLVQERINALKIGQKMQDLPIELWHKSFRFYVTEDADRKGGPNLRMIRLRPDRPSLTVTGYIFNKFVHPFENRFITVREAARLQGFPDDLQFKGSLTSSQLQVGNAVPVPLGAAVFKSILEALRRQYPRRRRFKALSFFSGAGGLDLAAMAASSYFPIDVQLAADAWADACDTLGSFVKYPVIQTDLASVSDTSEWLQYQNVDPKIDIVFGGPPCQAFSSAGKQHAVADSRGRLVFDFLRHVKSIDPPIFFMENVSNLESVGNGELFSEIQKVIRRMGYNLQVFSLLAADFGAPQLRRRLFFVGSKAGSVSTPVSSHSASEQLFSQKYVTVAEAFAGLPPARFRKKPSAGRLLL